MHNWNFGYHKQRGKDADYGLPASTEIFSAKVEDPMMIGNGIVQAFLGNKQFVVPNCGEIRRYSFYN